MTLGRSRTLLELWRQIKEMKIYEPYILDFWMLPNTWYSFQSAGWRGGRSNGQGWPFQWTTVLEHFSLQASGSSVLQSVGGSSFISSLVVKQYNVPPSACYLKCSRLWNKIFKNSIQIKSRDMSILLKTRFKFLLKFQLNPPSPSGRTWRLSSPPGGTCRD